MTPALKADDHSGGHVDEIVGEAREIDERGDVANKVISRRRLLERRMNKAADQ
jgi:acyl CoA:acetate/3-ketoacid CoA transferase beta subunit